MFLSNVYFNIVFIRLKPLTWNISITVSGERAGHVWTGPNINNTHRQQPASVTCAPSSSKGFAKKCVTRLCEWNATSCHIVSRRFRLSRLTRSTQHTCRPLRPQGGRSTPSCWSHVSDSPPTRRAWAEPLNSNSESEGEKVRGRLCLCGSTGCQAANLNLGAGDPHKEVFGWLGSRVVTFKSTLRGCVLFCVLPVHCLHVYGPHADSVTTTAW